MPRLGLQVYGRVQGVGFRYFTQQTAVALGLAGWVRNAKDGTVRIEAQGAEQPLQQFKVALGKGPRFASVQRVAEAELPMQEPAEAGFSIR